MQVVYKRLVFIPSTYQSHTSIYHSFGTPCANSQHTGMPGTLTMGCTTST